MKLKHTLKTVGLISAITCSGIFFTSCDDDKSEQIETNLGFDFSTLPVSRTVTNQFTFQSFVISTDGIEDIFTGEIHPLRENELLLSRTIENSPIGTFSNGNRAFITQYSTEGGNIQSVTLDFTPASFVPSARDIEVNISRDGNVNIINKYLSGNLSSQNEADQLAQHIGLGVDEQYNLFIVDKVAIDFVANTYTQTGKQVIINSLTKVTVTDLVQTRILALTN